MPCSSSSTASGSSATHSAEPMQLSASTIRRTSMVGPPQAWVVAGDRRVGGCHELASLAQARRRVEQEHASGRAGGVATDDEPVLVAPVDRRVGDADLLDAEAADVAEEVGLAHVGRGRAENRLGGVAAAPERVIPVRDGDAAPARVRERDAVAARPEALAADHAQLLVGRKGERSRVGAGELGREARAEAGRRDDDVAAKVAVGRRVHDGAVGVDARGVDLARAEEAHAETVELGARGVRHAREEAAPAGGRACRRASPRARRRVVAAVSVPISPAPTTTTCLLRHGQAPGERDEARARGVLRGLLEAGDRAASGSADPSPRRASAPRARAALLRPSGRRRADGGRGRMRSRRRRCARCPARRAAPRLRAAARDRSRARVWRAAGDRAAGPARSSSRARRARPDGPRRRIRRRRCRRPRQSCSCTNQSAPGEPTRR